MDGISRLEQIPEDSLAIPDNAIPMLPAASIRRSSAGLADSAVAESFDASGFQSPSDRFFEYAGCESPATQFFEGPMLLGNAAMPAAAPAMTIASPAYFPQAWPGVQAAPHIWGAVPGSTFSNSTPSDLSWGFAPPGMTEAWGAVSSPEASSQPTTSQPVAADASCTGLSSQVPHAVFVDLSCLRERTADAAGHQLAAPVTGIVRPQDQRTKNRGMQRPAPVAGIARPLKRAGGRGRNL